METLFHELIHLQFWEILDTLNIKYNKKEKLTASGKFWDLSEMAVNVVLKELKIPGYKYEIDSHVYPQHRATWNVIKKFCKEDFIIKSIEVKSKEDEQKE